MLTVEAITYLKMCITKSCDSSDMEKAGVIKMGSEERRLSGSVG